MAGAVAIVGVAGRFPGARSPAELWRMVAEERDATTWLTDEELIAAGEDEAALSDPDYVRAAMLLPDMEAFDAGFFGFSPREAAILDPQHRHFLETCWEAFEDAGHVPSRFKGSVGVFGGCGMQTYFARNLLPNPELVEREGLFLLRHTGNDKDFLTTRVSYLFNLQGPSIGVQTACSTSLVATHMAVQSLLAGECDLALAGGVSIEVPQVRGYRRSEGGILSSTGLCRAFDDDADGVLFGSGCGVVALRRLEDALADGDNIYAVIRGSAINNDGASKAGYLAPSVEGQASAAAEALAIADVEPSTIGYIEAHGTGTLVGDPIELTALADAYAGAPVGSIALASLKTNIGHLDTAAGVASLIKAAMALRHRKIPASLNFSKPNSRFSFATGPFRVAQRTQDWPAAATPRRAAVNSLGVGGTNAHVVLEEARARPASSSGGSRPQLVLLSAKTQTSLDALKRQWSGFLADPPNDFSAAAAAFTSHEGREHFPFRAAIVGHDAPSLKQSLMPAGARFSAAGQERKSPRIVFMYPGGGTQFVGAGRDLFHRSRVFREAVEVCFALLPPTVGAELRTALFERDDGDKAAAQQLSHPLRSVLAVFIIEHAMTALLRSWGVRPSAVMGHSAGEYAAAVAAGVMSLKDALSIVALRGELFAAAAPGGMLTVKASRDEVRALAGEKLDIAAINAPQLVVVSGDERELASFAERCSERGLEQARVRIDVAAHSRMLDPLLPRFRKGVEAVRLNEPGVTFISTLTGAAASRGELVSPDYWVQQLRNPVHFAEAAAAALDLPDTILLEVGPGQTLSALARLADGLYEPAAIVSTLRAPNEAADDEAVALAAAGALWANGVDIALEAVGSRERRRISLPTYAFERQRHWIDPPAAGRQANATPAAKVQRVKRLEDWLLTVEWSKQALEPDTHPKDHAWLVFADDSETSTSVVSHLVQSGARVLQVHPGASFERLTTGGWRIRPDSADDMDALLAAVENEGALPDRILHLWSIEASPPVAQAFSQPLGFDSLFLLGRSMQLRGWSGDRRLCALTRGVFALAGERADRPEFGALMGPCGVLPREIPDLTCQLVDANLSSVEGVSHAIIAECCSKASSPVVALRGSGRWIRAERQTEPSGARTDRLRERGVYLITGGLGALGLELAQHLASSRRARLALISRKGFAPRSEWTKLAAGSGEQADLARRLLLLEQSGAEVMTIACDIAERDQVASALETVRQRYGELNGVFHAAGVLDDALTAVKTLADAHRVMRPKIDGANNLDSLIPEGTLDVFAVFSSTSVLINPPGQIDYVAANAVVDAFAARRSDGLSIAWGVWADIGMAAREKHPSDELSTGLVSAPADWRLHEHRIAGRPVMPGVAYIDMLLGAIAEPRPKAMALEDMTILSPLCVPDGAGREVRTRISTSDTGATAVVESRGAAAEGWVTHAQARVVDDRALQPICGPAVEWKPVDAGRLTLAERAMVVGPRWRCLRSAATFGRFARGEVELGRQFKGDLRTCLAHPALVDVAATVGLFLLPHDLGRGVYAPVSIASLRLLAPLGGRFSTIAHLESFEPGRQATFDVDFRNQRGRLVAQIRGLTMQWVEEAALANFPEVRIDPGAPVFEQARAAGIRAVEAPQVIEAAFGAAGPYVAVSSIRLAALRALYAGPSRSGVQKVAGPTKSYNNEVEAQVAEMCADILGLPQMGPDDEFLAYGGGSLTGVRLFARIRKELGVELPLSALFQAPSVRALADLVRGARGSVEASVATDAAPGVVVPQTEWSPLVRISAGSPNRSPLFCVHGARGSVVLFKALADRLARDLPFYGLQARGADGRGEFHKTVEEMAQCYLQSIRSVQPHGPYRLAGYSGGGVVAYEMARMLKSMGETVELLTMFDTLAPEEVRRPVSVREKLRLLPRISAPFLIGAPFRKLAAAREARRIRQSQTGVAPEAASLLEIAGANAWNAYASAQAAYSPRPLQVPTLLFTARHAAMPYLRAGPQLGWERLVVGGLETVVVDAWHETVFDVPAVDRVAAVLDARLDALDAAFMPMAPRAAA
jgi:acyl transferase domain-containing protein/thioesterase domain-containing protein/acyl carrier protein